MQPVKLQFTGYTIYWLQLTRLNQYVKSNFKNSNFNFTYTTNHVTYNAHREMYLQLFDFNLSQNTSNQISPNMTGLDRHHDLNERKSILGHKASQVQQEVLPAC